MLKGRIFGIDQQYFLGDQEILLLLLLLLLLIIILIYIYMYSKCSNRL